MKTIDYNAPAGIYVYKGKRLNRAFNRQRLVFSRFSTLAQAIRYVVEVLRDGVKAARIEGSECDFELAEIRQIYESASYPLERRSRLLNRTPRTM